MKSACEKYDEIMKLIETGGHRQLLAFHDQLYELAFDKPKAHFGRPRPWIKEKSFFGFVFSSSESFNLSHD